MKSAIAGALRKKLVLAAIRGDKSEVTRIQSMILELK
mgnify:CR=1 FL=1